MAQQELGEEDLHPTLSGTITRYHDTYAEVQSVRQQPSNQLVHRRRRQ